MVLGTHPDTLSDMSPSLGSVAVALAKWTSAHIQYG